MLWFDLLRRGVTRCDMLRCDVHMYVCVGRDMSISLSLRVYIYICTCVCCEILPHAAGPGEVAYCNVVYSILVYMCAHTCLCIGMFTM